MTAPTMEGPMVKATVAVPPQSKPRRNLKKKKPTTTSLAGSAASASTSILKSAAEPTAPKTPTRRPKPKASTSPTSTVASRSTVGSVKPQIRVGSRCRLQGFQYKLSYNGQTVIVTSIESIGSQKIYRVRPTKRPVASSAASCCSSSTAGVPASMAVNACNLTLLQGKKKVGNCSASVSSGMRRRVNHSQTNHQRRKKARPQSQQQSDEVTSTCPTALACETVLEENDDTSINIAASPATKDKESAFLPPLLSIKIPASDASAPSAAGKKGYDHRQSSLPNHVIGSALMLNAGPPLEDDEKSLTSFFSQAQGSVGTVSTLGILDESVSSLFSSMEAAPKVEQQKAATNNTPTPHQQESPASATAPAPAPKKRRPFFSRKGKGPPITQINKKKTKQQGRQPQPAKRVVRPAASRVAPQPPFGRVTYDNDSNLLCRAMQQSLPIRSRAVLKHPHPLAGELAIIESVPARPFQGCFNNETSNGYDADSDDEEDSVAYEEDEVPREEREEDEVCIATAGSCSYYRVRVLGSHVPQRWKQILQRRRYNFSRARMFQEPLFTSNTDSPVLSVPSWQLQAVSPTAFWASVPIGGQIRRLPLDCKLTVEGPILKNDGRDPQTGVPLKKPNLPPQTALRTKLDAFPGMTQVVPAAQAILGSSECKDWANPEEVIETLRSSRPSKRLTSYVKPSDLARHNNNISLGRNEVVIDPSVQPAMMRAMMDYELIQLTDKTIKATFRKLGKSGGTQSKTLFVYKVVVPDMYQQALKLHQQYQRDQRRKKVSERVRRVTAALDVE